MMLLRNGRATQPQGFRVAPTSYAKIEALADQFRQFLPVVSDSQPYRLDAWRILEETMVVAGYGVRVGDTKEMGQVVGMTAPAEKLIMIREDIYDRLADDHVFSRSTVIHEVAHNLMQHAVTLQRSPLGSHAFYQDSEWQAKAMTAALMMPVDACRLAGTPASLAAMCGTSSEAAGYRLDQLRKSGVIK